MFVRELPRRMSRERGAKIHDGIPVHTPPTPKFSHQQPLLVYNQDLPRAPYQQPQMIAENEVENFENFKDCLSNTVIQKLAPNGGKPVKKIKGRKNEIKPVTRVVESNGEDSNDVADLADFIEVSSTEPSR